MALGRLRPGRWARVEVFKLWWPSPNPPGWPYPDAGEPAWSSRLTEASYLGQANQKCKWPMDLPPGTIPGTQLCRAGTAPPGPGCRSPTPSEPTTRSVSLFSSWMTSFGISTSSAPEAPRANPPGRVAARGATSCYPRGHFRNGVNRRPGTTNVCSMTWHSAPDGNVDFSEADILGRTRRPHEPVYDGSAVLVWRCFRTLRWPSPLQD